jgi:hypothetical protein
MPSSRTRIHLDPGEVTQLVRGALGSSARVASSRPLDGGTFNACWKVVLEGGQSLVLKVAPPPELPLLHYEQDLLRTEVDFYARVDRRAGSGGRWRFGRRDRQRLLPMTIAARRSRAKPLARGAARRPHQLDAARSTRAVRATTSPQRGAVGTRRDRRAAWRDAAIPLRDANARCRLAPAADLINPPKRASRRRRRHDASLHFDCGTATSSSTSRPIRRASPV